MNEEIEPYTRTIVGVVTQRYRGDGVCYRQDFRAVDVLYQDNDGKAIPRPENDKEEGIRLLQPYDLIEQPLTDETVMINSLGFVVGVVGVELSEMAMERDIVSLLSRKLFSSTSQKLVKVVWRIIGFDDRESKTLHVSVVGELVELKSQSRKV